jgi:phospholipid transport system substrate-binding protein
MPRRHAVLWLIALALVLGAAPPEDAVGVVRRTLDAALAIARDDASHDENLAALRSVTRGILDTRTMGRRAIGDVLAAQPPEQQAEYFDLFDQVMVRAYLSKLLLFRSPRFTYGDPRSTGDAVVVPTHIETVKDEYRVEYVMRERDGRWLATDVVVEGISLTDNYRSQFASLLRDRSFSELLDLMRAKVRPPRAQPGP